MNENENRNKAIQYWSHVYNAGVVVFDNPLAHKDSLKSLIETVLNTKLFSEIECLSGDENCNPCSLSTWLLEGIYCAAVSCVGDSSSEEFYIESQVKLLEATYDRSVFEYVYLAQLYLSLLGTICNVQKYLPFCGFIKEKHYLINATITPISLSVANEKQRSRYLDVLLRVLQGSSELFLSCCCLEGRRRGGLLEHFWSTVLQMIDLESSEALLSALPLISSVVAHITLEKHSAVLAEVFCALPSLLSLSSISFGSKKEEFIGTWKSLKNSVTLSDLQLKFFLKTLTQIKRSCRLEDFVTTELGSFLTLLSSISQVEDFLSNCSSWPLYDKAFLLESLIAKSLQNAPVLLERKNFEAGSSTFDVHKLSSHWKELLPVVIDTASSEDVTYGRIKSLCSVLSMITRILGYLDEEISLWKQRTILKFFGNDFPIILKCIVRHLTESRQNEVSEIAADCLMFLTNAPEASVAPLEPIEECWLNILSISSISADPVRVKLLSSMRNIPPGQVATACLNVFCNVISGLSSDVETPTQVVKSIPFVYLHSKTSPSQLIADILMPAMLSEREALQRAVLDATSDLVCAVAGTGRVFRSATGMEKIACCEVVEQREEDSTGGNVSQIASHLQRLFGLVFSSSSTVRHRFITLLPKLSIHLECLHSAPILPKILLFLSDPDIEVRREFANVVTTAIFGQNNVSRLARGDLITESNGNCADSFVKNNLDLFFSTVEHAIKTQLRADQWSDELQISLTTLTNVACFPVRDGLLRSLQLMMHFGGNCPLPLPSIASSIAAAHQTSSLALYYAYRPELSQFFGELVLFNQMQFACPVALTMSSIVLFFNGLSKGRFASGSEQYMTPVLLAAMVKQAGLETLLQDYADYVGQSLPVILTRSFHNIYVYIWLNETETVFRDSMALIEQSLNIKVPDLILHSQKVIIHQFLFNLHKNEELVLRGLATALNLTAANIKEKIAASLESRFVGFLLFLVGKFTKEGSAECEKVETLESLASVLHLMGRRRVTPVSRKVLATLQTTLTLNKQCYGVLQCKAWDAFIRTVDVREIGPILATIVVSLLSLLDVKAVENAVVRLIKFLLVEQKDAVANFMPSIIFLPEHPALKLVHDSIRSYVSFECEDIKERLQREMTLALHETVGVRLEGLKALLKTLQTSPEDIHTLINGSDEPDPCVTALWDSLVTCCRDADKKIAQAAAVCLGELGAVDPGLVPRKLKPRNALPLSVHDPEFGFLALNEIVRGFQNARTSVDMDAFAIGLQELLKIFSVTEAADNATWSRFSSTDQALLRPMLTSRYKVQVPVRTMWPDTIFRSREASAHMRWAALWAGKLVAQCSDTRAVVLFRACEPSIKRDPKVLLFFLQYIVLYMLTQDSLHHDALLREMEAVLSWSPGNSEPQVQSIPVRLLESCGYPLIRSSMTDTDARACAMTVFLIVDFLYYWTRSYLAKNYTQTAEHLRKRDYTLVKEFLTKIDLAKMAEANFDMQEYPRAIQCWEDLARSSPELLKDHLAMLSKAYARYGDLDSVGGARVLQGSAPDAEDQLFYHQVSRQMEEVRILYEQLAKSGKMAPSEVEGMVLCYLRLGEPSTAYSHILRNIDDPPEMSVILSESMAECLMKLGDWSKLDNFLQSELGSRECSWYTQLGRITLDLERGKLAQVTEAVSQARAVLVDNFTALGMHSGNESQGYHCLLKLQILNEIEKVGDIMSLAAEDESLRPRLLQLLKHWEAKESLVQSESEYLEQLLSTRRTLLTVLAAVVPNPLRLLLHHELGKYWVKSAELARKAGCLHQAYNYVLSAEPYNIPHTFIQKAQLLWDKGDQEESLSTLTRGIATHFPDVETMKCLPPDDRLEDRKMTAEAKLLYAVYNEETSNCSSYTNMSHYQDAFDVCRQLEKTQVLLAQCLDRGLSLIDEKEQGDSKACDLRVMMVSHFGKSLMNGCEYIYQTVPRMLTIWLDLGENLSTNERVRAMNKINKLIQVFTERLPPFILMTALPQLLSRIGHPNREVFLLLKNILVTLIRTFPQQCLWAIQTLAKSSVPERSIRYKEVIQDPGLRNTVVFKLIEDFTSLCDKLNKLTNKNLPQDSITRGILVSSVVRELPLLLNSDQFSNIILPITRFSAISLPKSVSSVTHQPFPKHPVTIAGIKNEMTVLPSLQRPRKITFLGSDGKPYDILCKPKDDLRRDARLMEFNNIVNMYLHRDPESRARHLHIRTYVVTPLGESGGLLEWVPNLVGLRPALLQLYKQHGKFVSTRELRKHELQVRDPLEKKRAVYLEKLLPMHPPLFYEWFRVTFPDPAGWYAARQAFTRTTAVMSMVGYILGLGDRHGENILFDSESGDTIHVDFNCLFNKGENFDWKERVPFRLTHNMTTAMGPCGVEGTFRKSCEISMRVLRAQGKTLMSVLTPFAYDPFGSWSKNKEIMQQEKDQKIAEALEELSDIEKRLNGSLRVKQRNNTFYLSVEGLVRSLITEATSVDNLCQMYLGWGAYL